MSREEILFAKALKKVNNFLKFSGIYFDEEDINRNAAQRFLSRKFYCFNLLWLALHIIGEFLWAIDGIKTKASIVKLTYLIPGVTLSVLGCCKSYYLVKNGNLVSELIRTIKSLQSEIAISGLKPEIENDLNKRMVILTTVVTANSFLDGCGVAVFVVGPLVLSWLIYNSTGKLVMQLPFLAKFPFDETDIRFWPLAYIHQVWSCAIAVSTVHGPDGFYALSCTFLVIQFKTLQYDIERIIPESEDFALATTQDEFRMRLSRIVRRHLELIRCVDTVEAIFSKSNLCNVAVSSIVICVSAFNILTLGDFFLIPFIAFLIMWTIQVFVLCYYSDLLIESSTDVSDAVYRSKWYTANSAIMKDLLFVLTRAQKPCKLTAAGYVDLNLAVFNKIMSTAWSYFALLHTVYNK
ncbi:hypothetical protein ABMA27_016060 [Loxostege sticticalis]|uniref:Odorant receptor n=1 Tax=Loxostege sticticalis TaxID=481309 RepID=A0ABR3I5D4_LOXSC